MRKTLILVLTVFLAVVLTYGFANAITGQCSNCHTMHNSQNGEIVNAGGPYEQLLNADCIPCHTGPVVTDRQNSFSAPIVLGTVDPGGQGGGLTLAGGDFWWVATGTPGRDDRMGHNVAGIAPADTTITNPNGLTPPGWDPSATPGALSDGQINSAGLTWSTQLTCAGLYGCHGNHTDPTPMGGIRGAHHGNTGSTSTQANNPTTIGGSYRFLGGINGLEKADWNWVETEANHNEYYGVSSPDNRDQSSTTYANKRTISYACAQCHGFFHSRIDNSTTGVSPWLRHPTDVVLPASGEYQFYNPDNSNFYSVEAPVARQTVPATSSSTVTPGTDIVMCLSCHRAHGSPQPDILRWDYTTMLSGVGTSDTGCFTCHTQKNAD
jgi:predicted CXXCH cytochrome family protein